MLATFAATMVILLVAHNLADHVTGQTSRMAATKAAPTAEQVAAGARPHQGWGANLAHVGLYHLTLIILGGAAYLVLPLHWTLPGIATALAFSAVTHAVLDRRWPVRRLLTALGSRDFANLATGGMNGMYLADQALHHTALLVSAVLLTRL